MMKYIVLMVLTIFTLHSETLCHNNNEANTLETQKKLTNNMIGTKKDELEDAIDGYKKALEKKKEMMTKLWKTVTKIEFLMKENQVLRKKTLKYWEDVKQSHAHVQSL